ncbi:hypothetical protein IEE_02958, partial [Bacillus cereus BAG5X1-1]
QGTPTPPTTGGGQGDSTPPTTGGNTGEAPSNNGQ